MPKLSRPRDVAIGHDGRLYLAHTENSCIRAVEVKSPAAACLERDWQDFVTFYAFPEEHWVHLRTSNPIESIFSGVRLRTDASKRLRVPENALYLVFKLLLRLSLNWRSINAR
jgi:putative transposase